MLWLQCSFIVLEILIIIPLSVSIGYSGRCFGDDFGGNLGCALGCDLGRLLGDFVGDDDDVVDVNYIKKVYDEKSNDGDDEMMMTSRKDNICGISGRKRYLLHKLFFSLPKH